MIIFIYRYIIILSILIISHLWRLVRDYHENGQLKEYFKINTKEGLYKSYYKNYQLYYIYNKVKKIMKIVIISTIL